MSIIPLLLFSIIALLFCAAEANVEKIVFIAPPRVAVPSEEPDLDDLGLERLSPESPIIRTQLNALFPTDDTPFGADSWFFLENLTPGKRYEVRVCWLATQPTSFTLSTYTIGNTLEDPSLLAAISRFSSFRLASVDQLQANTVLQKTKAGKHDSSASDSAPTSDSALFLRIFSAADYYSLDTSLMDNVPPILVDIILDPFLLNVFPRSLVPTACWITVVAAIALLVARWVTMQFQGVIVEAEAGMRRDTKIEQSLTIKSKDEKKRN